MQTNKILTSELIDIIFDGRNKEYGAYELRKNYSKRVRNSLLVTGIIASVAIGSSVLANSMKKNDSSYKIVPGIVITQIPDEKEPEPLPEPERKQPEPEQVRTEKFTTPEILPDEEVQSPPPDQETLEKAVIDVETKSGIDDDGTSKPPQSLDERKGIVEAKTVKEPEGPFTTVEIDAKFTGNWKSFLERNLDAEVPLKNDAPAGRYSVMIQFVVDLDGTVSDIKALTNIGYGMEQEAIRVIKKSAKWEPAIQNGHQVKAYRKQMITFVVEGDE